MFCYSSGSPRAKQERLSHLCYVCVISTRFTNSVKTRVITWVWFLSSSMTNTSGDLEALNCLQFWFEHIKRKKKREALGFFKRPAVSGLTIRSGRLGLHSRQEIDGCEKGRFETRGSNGWLKHFHFSERQSARSVRADRLELCRGLAYTPGESDDGQIMSI